MEKVSLNHIVGGSLLVAGTSIGAGMLALPLVSAMGGFLPSILIYLIAWAIMTMTGFLYLELSLHMKKDSNLLSMTSHYIGSKAKIFTWIVYLFLFYGLLISYISAGGGLVFSVFDEISLSTCNLIFVLVLGAVVYFGTRAVDRINILLVIGLAITYFLFVFFAYENVNFDLLKKVNFENSFLSFPVILLSFGFQATIPTLTYYMKKDEKKIKLAIFLGTTLALLVYLVWDFLILGIIPIEGAHGLKEAIALGQSATEPLKYHTQIKMVYSMGQFFSFFAITTSFLGVSIGLFDFLADGLNLKKKKNNRLAIAFLTFVPPAMVAIINPGLFLIALKYAGGIGGVLLLILLPSIMVYIKRYRKNELDYRSFIGKFLIILIIIFSVCELLVEIIQEVFRFVS